MRDAPLQPPAREGIDDGLAWSLFLGADDPPGTVVILHGAGSTRSSHFDFARVCTGHGLAALVFDARGHGDSGGAMDGRAIADVAAMAGLARSLTGAEPVGLRGSSMGGFLSLASAAAARARAVVAICPAPGEGLARGLRAGRLDFAADEPALEALLVSVDLAACAEALGEGLLLLHAQGDEQVPVEHSQLLHDAAPGSRLIAVPGGHHRSVQHDPELQDAAARFLARALRAAPGVPG